MGTGQTAFMRMPCAAYSIAATQGSETRPRQGSCESPRRLPIRPRPGRESRAGQRPQRAAPSRYFHLTRTAPRSRDRAGDAVVSTHQTGGVFRVIAPVVQLTAHPAGVRATRGLVIIRQIRGKWFHSRPHLSPAGCERTRQVVRCPGVAGEHGTRGCVIDVGILGCHPGRRVGYHLPIRSHCRQQSEVEQRDLRDRCSGPGVLRHYAEVQVGTHPQSLPPRTAKGPETRAAPS